MTDDGNLTPGGLEDRVRALEEELAKAVRRPRRRTARSALVLSGFLALGITGVATGVTGDVLQEGSRNPSTGTASSETTLVANHGNFTLNAQNSKTGDGGGLSAGCSSVAPNEACLYSQNIGGGHAFKFWSNGGEGGRIETSQPGAKPFTTNATGVATGLNADKVDGKDASELVGPQGPKGDPGPQGPAGVGGFQKVVRGQGCAGTCTGEYYSTQIEAYAGCPYGTTLVGGGFDVVPGRYYNWPAVRPTVSVQRDGPMEGYDYWVTRVTLPSLSFLDLKAYALCVAK